VWNDESCGSLHQLLAMFTVKAQIKLSTSHVSDTPRVPINGKLYCITADTRQYTAQCKIWLGDFTLTQLVKLSHIKTLPDLLERL